MASLFLIKSTAGAAVDTTSVRAGAQSRIRPPQEAEDAFRTERFLALMVIAVAALYQRVLDPNFGTAFMDESIYVLYGRMFLTHRFEAPLDQPLHWSFGWYLWPAMAAAADWIGGLLALREMAAVLGVVTVGAVYGFASRVFSKPIGLGAAALAAVLAPAILVSRIATRDSGSICFFALGLWAYATAWREDKKRWWAWAAVFFFASFLCKYLVAIYFPLLVLAAFKKGKKPLLVFSLPLFLVSMAYLAVYYKDIVYLLKYATAYGSLKAPTAEALKIYFWGRWDFWLLAVLGLIPFFRREWRVPAALLWAGALAMLLFQMKSRADYDYWKHVNYSLLFLSPLAVAGVLHLAETFQKSHYGQMVWGVCMVAALAGGVAILGSNQKVEKFIFWPNVDPILAYFEGRLNSSDKVLVDDTVLRYYFTPALHQYQITDPMFFRYGNDLGVDAYKTAVREGAFSYIVMNGGIGEEARVMDGAVKPLPESYRLVLAAIEPTLGHKIEIYARSDKAAETPQGPEIQITSPVSNAIVNTNGGATTVQGTTAKAQPGWYAQVEIFTNRWYRGGRLPIAADGSFHEDVQLGGEGREQCYHLLRARLFDSTGELRAFTLNYAIARANPDGSAPACRGQ